MQRDPATVQPLHTAGGDFGGQRRELAICIDHYQLNHRNVGALLRRGTRSGLGGVLSRANQRWDPVYSVAVRVITLATLTVFLNIRPVLPIYILMRNTTGRLPPQASYWGWARSKLGSSRGHL